MATTDTPRPASAPAAERAATAPMRPPRRPAGWRTVARKDLADHLRSIRFALLVLLLSLAAVAAVVAAAGQLRGVAPEVAGLASVFLRLFTITFADTPFSFVSFVAIIGPLLGIAFGFDAINSERSQRTLPRLVSQPIHRDDIVNGKFVAGLAAIAVVLTALTAVVAGIGILGLGVVPTVADAGRMLAWLVVSILYVSVWLALSILLSVRVRRAATSAMAALAVWLVLTLFGGLIAGLLADAVAPATPDASADDVMRNVQVERSLARVSPGYLYEEAIGPLLAPEQRTLAAAISPLQAHRAVPGELPVSQSLLLVWPHVVGLLAMAVVLFAAGYVSFLREEVRA
jgi:ABC-2 type transport system permease protein